MARFDINQYVDVQERITQFWKDYPDGRIVTYMISDPNIFERVVVRAEIYKHRDHPAPDATDLAAEEQGKGGMANATSWHENASTSAIGRALANMGYATTRENRPSQQEMQKAARQDGPVSAQNAPRRDEAPRMAQDTDTSPLVNQGGISNLHAVAAKRNLNHQDVHHLVVARYNLASVKELTGRKLAELLKEIETLPDERLADLVLTGRDLEAGALPGMPAGDRGAQFR